MKLYIAGPMSGIEEHNYPAFHALAASLREKGYEVINPAELSGDDRTKPWHHYMKQDLKAMMDCDAVVVLPGWEASKGANVEVQLARELKMPVLRSEDLQPLKETVLQEAQRIVHGPRRASYGHPLDSQGRIADMWTVALGPFLKPGEKLTWRQVNLCLMLLKVAREIHAPARDNIVDLVGYSAITEICEEEEKRRKEEQAKMDELQAKIDALGVAIEEKGIEFVALDAWEKGNAA